MVELSRALNRAEVNLDDVTERANGTARSVSQCFRAETTLMLIETAFRDRQALSTASLQYVYRLTRRRAALEPGSDDVQPHKRRKRGGKKSRA